MKKLILSIALFCPLLVAPGCGGKSGGNTVEDAEQSAIDAYMAAEKESQAAMDGSLEAK